ncbi:MAG: transporter substrate-binding domain-containing protein [Vulcanimicrobiaceae bacterium]
MSSCLTRVGALGALAALATVAVPSVASADDTLATIRSRGKMIVGVKADYPPFGFLDGERNVGLEIDLLHDIARDLLGKPDAIEFVPVVSANRFQFLNTGKVDFLFSTVTITEARKLVVDFSQPYMRSGWQVLVKRSDAAVREASDLKGKTAVVVPGSTGEAGLSKLVPDATLLKLPQTSEALDAVDQGRADAFVQDAALLVGLTAQKPQYKVVGSSHDDMPIGAACRKGDAAPCEFVSTEIAKFAKSGLLAREYRKWLYGAAKRFMP